MAQTGDDCAALGPDKLIMDAGVGSSIVASSEVCGDIKSHSLTGNVRLPLMDLSLQAGEMHALLAQSADTTSASQGPRQGSSNRVLPVISLSTSFCPPVVGTGLFISPFLLLPFYFSVVGTGHLLSPFYFSLAALGAAFQVPI